MIDQCDWEQEDAELNAICDAHRHTSFPPGVLEDYIARRMRRMRMIQAEIEEVFRQAATDPALMDRLNQPL